MTHTAAVPHITPNPNAATRLFAVREAVVYQFENCGRIPFGREVLYSIAHRRLVPVVMVGARKVLFPPSSIDLLLSGMVPL